MQTMETGARDYGRYRATEASGPHVVYHLNVALSPVTDTEAYPWQCTSSRKEGKWVVGPK